MKHPLVAFLLSLAVPGLGQFYVKEKAEGLSLLCIAAGAMIALVTNRSLVTFILVGPIYLLAMVPSAVDAYQTAAGKPRMFRGESVPYVIIMLVTVGPFAIPLLWRSTKFSKAAKIVLTVFATLIALAGILAVTVFASFFEGLLEQSSGAAAF